MNNRPFLIVAMTLALSIVVLMGQLMIMGAVLLDNARVKDLLKTNFSDVSAKEGLYAREGVARDDEHERRLNKLEQALENVRR